MKANQRFGRLTLVEPAQGAVKKWLCRCDCGKTTSVWTSNLQQGLTKSCGCLRRNVKASTMARAFPLSGVRA